MSKCFHVLSSCHKSGRNSWTLDEYKMAKSYNYNQINIRTFINYFKLWKNFYFNSALMCVTHKSIFIYWFFNNSWVYQRGVDKSKRRRRPLALCYRVTSSITIRPFSLLRSWQEASDNELPAHSHDTESYSLSTNAKRKHLLCMLCVAESWLVVNKSELNIRWAYSTLSPGNVLRWFHRNLSK